MNSCKTIVKWLKCTITTAWSCNKLLFSSKYIIGPSSHSSFLPSFLSQLYYITAWRSQVQTRREKQGRRRGCQLLWPPTRGGRHSDWGAISCVPAVPPASPSLLSLFLSLFSLFSLSSRFPLPVTSSLFLCQPVVSRLLSFPCHVPPCPFLSLFFSLILLVSVSFPMSLFCFNIKSLAASWQLPLLPGYRSPAGISKKVLKVLKDHKTHHFFVLLHPLRASIPPSSFCSYTNFSLQCPAVLTHFCLGEPRGESSWSRSDIPGREETKGDLDSPCSHLSSGVTGSVSFHWVTAGHRFKGARGEIRVTKSHPRRDLLKFSCTYRRNRTNLVL